MAHRDLRVLDAANLAADLINELIDRAPKGQLLHATQLRSAVQSVVANIKEGFGRGPGRDCDRSLKIARGEAEEALGHLATDFRAKRIAPRDYWPPRNVLVVVTKMLTGLLNH